MTAPCGSALSEYGKLLANGNVPRRLSSLEGEGAPQPSPRINTESRVRK